MNKILITITILLAVSLATEVQVAPLSQKSMYGERDVQYQRGTYCQPCDVERGTTATAAVANIVPEFRN